MSKKKLICPTEIIADMVKQASVMRSRRGIPEGPPEPVEVRRVRDIAQALDDLRWKDQPEHKEPTALELAVCDYRWDLIRKATFLLEREVLERLDPRRLADDAKWLAFCLASIESPKLGKADILDYIEKVHPDIFKTIPRTQKARSSWWEEVGGEQVRGYTPPQWKKQFSALIQRGIDMRKAGFPDFLGPRENPHWE